jgi:hypothetical protein
VALMMMMIQNQNSQKIWGGWTGIFIYLWFNNISSSSYIVPR